MEEYRYNCNYCGVEYTPKRRRVQKYCCASCRVNAFNQRKTKGLSLPSVKNTEPHSTKDKMSLSGIGNAAVGTLATDLVKNLFTREENKPATKGDIQELIKKSNEENILILNIPPRNDGARAYFNIKQQAVFYKK